MKQKLRKCLKSQYAQIILFLILVFSLIVSYVHLNEVIKLAGLPFKILPNALGITQSVSRHETREYEVAENTNIVIVIEQPGYYYIFTSFLYEWLVDAKIKIETPQGREIKVVEWRGVARPYDTIYARGAPSHRFYIEEPGPYRFYFIPRVGNSIFADPSPDVSSENERELSHTKFKISIAPDYVTRNERTYQTFYKIQGGILFVLCVIFYYFKVARGNSQKKDFLQAQKLEKQKRFEEFLRNQSPKK